MILCGTEFAYDKHRVDALCTRRHGPPVAGVIESRQGDLPMKSKTIIHIGQMSVKIARLKAVAKKFCLQIKKLKDEVESIQAKEKD
ncbi:hypothetical protein MMC22_006297 [Lobaria immixta]|nr:hypothetical protein [Lobaria immixta]